MTTDPLVLAAALLIGTLASARATRLLTSDAYPPAEWVRTRWQTWAGQTEAREAWAPLLVCPFCAAPYLVAVNLTWALCAGLDWGDLPTDAWWVVNVWAAVSYAASMIVVRDEPPAEEA